MVSAERGRCTRQARRILNGRKRGRLSPWFTQERNVTLALILAGLW